MRVITAGSSIVASTPLMADLARPGLLGRYMALSSLSWQLGFVVEPAIGGAILDRHPGALWLLASGVCAVGAVWALALEPSLPRRVRRTSGGPDADAIEADRRRRSG